MDCEKFDRVVLDQLYEELDELTSAAAKRHVEHCMRCRRIEAGLRATREVGVLPVLEPPPQLLGQILAAERAAHAELPLRQRIGRAISIMAGYAMRPQLAMAALLLLMIGGSLLFLRARPGDRNANAVAERGVPESEGETTQVVPVPPKAAEPAPGAFAHGTLDDESKDTPRRDKAETEDESKHKAQPETKPELSAAAGGDAEDAGTDPEYGEAMAAFNGGRYAEAERRFGEIASEGGAKAAAAALLAAQAARNGQGCGVAVDRFEQVANRFPGTGTGNEAAWQAGDCYRALGRYEEARRHYRTLLATAYAGRAQQALGELDQRMAARSAHATAGKAAKVKAAAAPNATAAEPSQPNEPAKPAEPSQPGQ